MPARKTVSDTKAKAAPKRRTARKTKPATDHEAIAARAYFIHLEEGSHDEAANWFRAERELTAA